jgi:hypothetical protein
MTRLSMAMRFAAASLLALAFATAPSASHAASGTVSLDVVKAAFIIGASGGNGTLSFQGKRYPLSIGGVSFGASIGASRAQLVGRVTNIRRPSDVAGTYGAATAGGAIITGGKVVRLRNEKGAVLELRGREVGLEFNLDVSGMVIGLR